MNANPALAPILGELLDCNRAYINKLQRIEESAQEAAHRARTLPYMSDIDAHLVMDMARLHGTRTALTDAAYSMGATEEQIQMALSGDSRDFCALRDTIVGK